MTMLDVRVQAWALATLTSEVQLLILGKPMKESHNSERQRKEDTVGGETNRGKLTPNSIFGVLMGGLGLIGGNRYEELGSPDQGVVPSISDLSLLISHTR